MPIRLTPEQIKAIDEHPGRPVYVLDVDRHESFVLLPSSEFDKVRLILEYDANNGEWSDEKNARRIELIDKKIAGTIAPTESVELAMLQRQAEAHFDETAPPPMDGVAELHQQLLSRDQP
jgi:hypothetical protein